MLNLMHLLPCASDADEIHHLTNPTRQQQNTGKMRCKSPEEMNKVNVSGEYEPLMSR